MEQTQCSIGCCLSLLYFGRVSMEVLTGQFADKPTCGQSSRRLVNSRTSQLADNRYLNIMEIVHYICTVTLNSTQSYTESAQIVLSTRNNT